MPVVVHHRAVTPGKPVGWLRRTWRWLMAALDAEIAREQLSVDCPHTSDPLDACQRCVDEARADRW